MNMFITTEKAYIHGASLEHPKKVNHTFIPGLEHALPTLRASFYKRASPVPGQFDDADSSGEED